MPSEVDQQPAAAQDDRLLDRQRNDLTKRVVKLRRPPTMDASQMPRGESLARIDPSRAWCVTHPNTAPPLCESRRRRQRHPEVRVGNQGV